MPSGHQDTHWGQALGLGLLLTGPRLLPVCGDRPPPPQEMQIPPREAGRNSCAQGAQARCCSGTTGPSRSNERAWSRQRLRGAPGHCCSTRTRVLSCVPVPAGSPLNMSGALRATGGERQDSGPSWKLRGLRKGTFSWVLAGGVGHTGEVGLRWSLPSSLRSSCGRWLPP